MKKMGLWYIWETLFMALCKSSFIMDQYSSKSWWPGGSLTYRISTWSVFIVYGIHGNICLRHYVNEVLLSINTATNRNFLRTFCEKRAYIISNLNKIYGTVCGINEKSISGLMQTRLYYGSIGWKPNCPTPVVELLYYYLSVFRRCCKMCVTFKTCGHWPTRVEFENYKDTVL
jgi:hypothetical protein